MGNRCVASHEAKLEHTIADINLSSHVLHLVPAAEMQFLKIRNACNACQTDKTTARADVALKTSSDY